MRILYDSNGFQERIGGVSRSFVELIKHLPSTIEPVLAVRQTCNLALQAEPFNLPSCPNQYESFLSRREFRGKWRLWRLAQRLFPDRYPDFEAANEQCLKEQLACGDFDVLHLTGAHVYGAAWRQVAGNCPIVITVHDLIPEIVQHNQRVANMRREMLSAASHVIAVSENTKRDIIRLYGISESKITVIHHGYSCSSVSPNPQSLIPNPYLLYVGKRDGYKNWAWLVETIAPLLKSRQISLVCTGSPLNSLEKRLLRRLGIADKVEQQFVTDRELGELYSHAVAFVAPSTYEGFGLPLLEAFAAGCPVLAANASCFPEIAGDCALYFDLSQPYDLRTKLSALMEDSALRSRLIVSGGKRLSAFSWDKAARQLASVYEKVFL